MKTKNTDSTIDAKKAAKEQKKLEAEKLRKQKKREAAKAKRLKLIEKRKAKVEANKKKRAEKKAKKLAKLEKIKAKKLALKQKKQALRQKKLEKLAKQKAKAKELKLKAKEKAKLQKQKIAKKDDVQTPKNNDVDIAAAIKAIKTYVKLLSKTELDAKKQKKHEKLGFVFADDTVAFTLATKRKVKKQSAKLDKPDVVTPDVVTPDVVSEPETIDEAIDKLESAETDAIEALANDIEDDDNATEVPVGDTFTDDVDTTTSTDDFLEEEDDTIDDARDEQDEGIVGFRQEWNAEFGDDGERNDD